MTTLEQDPIEQHWPSDTADATAAELAEALAHLTVTEVADRSITPMLAASAAELAMVAGIPWRFSTDDAAVALLRIVARVSIVAPGAAGPHTTQLLRRLLGS